MTDAPAIQWCSTCKQPMLTEGNACPRCGQALVPVGAVPSAAQVKWYHSIWFVLFMLFFVLGPLGLPLLWKSSRFSRGAKIGWTIAVMVYSIWAIFLVVRAAQATISHFGDLEKSFLF